MSFEQLMAHAREIQRRAIEEEIKIFRQEAAKQEGSTGASVEVVVQQIRPEIEKRYSDVPSLFQPFADMPEPQAFDGLINELGQALNKLSSGETPKDPINGTIYPANPVLNELSGAESYIENWTGQAAQQFKSEFIDPFPSIVSNQFIVATVLKAALEAEKEIWVTARNDIDKIAHDVLEALDRMHDCGKNEWTMTFTVIASVAAIAAVPVTGGASLAITAVGAASQVVAAAAPEDPPKIQFSGETPGPIISQMREAIKKEIELIGQAEQKIADAMKGAGSVVSGNMSLFVAKEPALAGADTSNITSPEYMGYSR